MTIRANLLARCQRIGAIPHLASRKITCFAYLRHLRREVLRIGTPIA
jgi:hypothetical protein